MYILSISPKAFIKQGQENEIIIVSDPNKATIIETIGDAMKIASIINTDFEADVVKVLSTSVSSNL